MANFNEKINLGTGHILFDQDYLIYREKSMQLFERLIDSYLFFRKNAYRLCIQYKDTHPVENVAGRCFMWNFASATSDSVEVRILNCDSNEDFSYFGDPVFASIAGAIFITDKYVVTYGDTRIEAVEISGEHVVCNAYVCGRFVSKFRIPAEVFDRCFGLKENFPKQYEKVFGKTEDAKPVQEENNLIEEAKRNVEWCKNSLITNKYRLEKAVHLIQGALEDFDVKWHELDDMLYKLTQKEERRDVKNESRE